MTESTEKILKIARASLEANIETIGAQSFLTAGRGQFRSLWSRDFCHSVGGLLAIGQSGLVRDQLELLLSHRRSKDALIPRTLDSIPAQWRVTRHVLGTWVPSFRKAKPVSARLKPEYKSENGSEAIDTNALFLLAALDYVQSTGDREWWTRHESELLEVYHYYDRCRQGELIVQPEFSDWQDSVRRSGSTFLTNLLYWAARTRLEEVPAFALHPSRNSELRAKIFATFIDPSSGLFRSVAGERQISLEGNLLAIDLGFLSGSLSIELFSALKRHPLWTSGAGIPGFVTYPDYPEKSVSLFARWVGLRHYHDRLYWSWLIGLSLKVARKMGDEQSAEAIVRMLSRVLDRDGVVAEVYLPGPDLKTWQSRFLKAEKPFSWGAARILEAFFCS